MNFSIGRCLAVLLLTSAAVLFTGDVVRAQVTNGVLAIGDLNRMGLERMWLAQIEVDVASGRVMHLTQHVSARDTTTFFEVVHDKGKFVYGERDLDKFGRVIGKEEAQKFAQLKFTELQRRNVNAKLVTQVVPRITLYSVTDAGVIQAIDAETGRTLWKTPVGKAQYPTEAVAASDEFVAVINGTSVYVLKAATGEGIWNRRVSGAPGAGPAVSDFLVFVPMVNGLMEAYPLDDVRKPAVTYRSHGRVMLQPIYTGSNVAWPTDKGHLYVSTGSQHRVGFRLEANAAIAAPCSIMPPSMIIASSADGFVYCMHESSGALQWRFSAGEPILTSPVAFGDIVFATTSDNTLFAIDGKLGQERWSTPHITRVIGSSATRLYCLNDVEQLEILDRNSGSRVGAIASQQADLPYLNRETDRLIIGTSQGVLQCMREVTQEYPMLHIPVTKSEEPTPKRGLPTAKPKPTATESSPFGESNTTEPPAPAPGGADPFGGEDKGGEDKGGEPKPPERKAGDDPFGG